MQACIHNSWTYQRPSTQTTIVIDRPSRPRLLDNFAIHHLPSSGHFQLLYFHIIHGWWLWFGHVSFRCPFNMRSIIWSWDGLLRKKQWEWRRHCCNLNNNSYGIQLDRAGGLQGRLVFSGVKIFSRRGLQTPIGRQQKTNVLSKIIC